MFEKIFKDRDTTRHRFAGLTYIRNKIAHSGAITDSERKGFEYYSEEIRKALLENVPDHETAGAYLERYGEDARDAYLGAVRAAHQDAYPDQTVQFAHSLREVIDLLAKEGQTQGEADRRRKGGRAAAIQRAVDPYGGSPLGDDYAMLDDMYERLSGIAHHRKTVGTGEALDMLAKTCGALLRIARLQLEVEEEVGRVIRGGPSEAGARRLKELSAKEVTRTSMGRLLTPDWLPHLIDAGLFGEPSSGAGGGRGGEVRIARPLSDYLARCARRFPDHVSRLVLACPASRVRSDPHLYPDFLRCAVAFDPETMEKTAQKALGEGWTDILVSYRFVEPFATFIESLFKNKKYEAGAALAYDALQPKPYCIEGDSEHAVKLRIEMLDASLFASALGEIARRVVRVSTKGAVELLARLLEAHSKEVGHAPWAVPGRVASIEDSVQNGDAHVNAVVSELRDALERIGGDSTDLLRSILPALYRKDGILFRRLELYVYRRFPRAFAGETALSLKMYFDVREAHHEYYHLLRESFAGLPERARESLYALVDRACAGGGERGPGGDPAADRMAHKKFLFLHAIRAHLDKRHAEEYERLLGAFGGPPPRPDYMSHVETTVGGGAEPAAPPGRGDADGILREAVSSGPPAESIDGYGDRVADRLEARVAQYPGDYAPKSAELEDARPAIQCAFLAGLEEALQEKRLAGLPDLAELSMHIIRQELDDPSRRNEYGQWDPLRRLCWLLDASFRVDAVGPEVAGSLKETILALAEAGGRRGPLDCVEYQQDALSGAINGVGGLSFILLFRHWLWLGRAGGADGGSFGPTLRKIVDGYIDGGAKRHTTCRHSAIGLFAVAILQGDPAWFRAVVERMGRTKEKAAFWAAYVTKNELYEEAFEAIWKYYDMFLNGGRLYELKLDKVVDATFQHVALAYFYGFEHADAIFKKFVRTAKQATIKRTVMPLTLIMKGKEDDKDFDKGKLARLWKEEQYSQLDLGAWFRHTPLDKRTAIGLYRDYLGRYRGKIDMLAAPVDELEKYAGEFPAETAACLLRMVERSRMVDIRAAGRVVELLEARGGAGTGEACRAIREALAERGFGLDGSRG